MPSSTTDKQVLDAKAAAAERRRTNKPIMEKKRRQRINDCLNQLKNLVLEGLKKDPSRYSKLEKADILEMTVRHVQALHRHEAAAPRQPPVDAAAKFRAGFGQCAAEVGKFLESDTTLSNVQRSRILLHLTEVMTGLRNKSSLDTVAPLTPEPQRVPQAAPYDSLMVGGVPLVPARLLNGQMTFVLPNDITTSFPSHGGELHRAPPSPPPSAASPSLSLVSSSPPPSPSRSPSPQPLDLAPVRHPEDDNCWRPW
ncbi:transcription factor HES-4-like [Portunus trituberculatus]|uniref:transcription factor HES-4-like n=1 Tax=Portunus trituberculatus TaxID=210409 RepID=UPI001E1CF268|nr:transcription factor HES-4-like [Portunus trituberculatus]